MKDTIQQGLGQVEIYYWPDLGKHDWRGATPIRPQPYPSHVPRRWYCLGWIARHVCGYGNFDLTQISLHSLGYGVATGSGRSLSYWA